jgi:membrane-associated phospholipid phosphatase
MVAIAEAADPFLDVASALATPDASVRHTDAAVQDWVRLHRTPLLNAVFIGATTGGGPVGMTATGGVLLVQLLKTHYTRLRPDLSGASLSADGYSFPSGHALNGTVVLCAIGYLAARAVPTWTSKSPVFAAFITLDLAIAASRLYLGVYWTSDVAAGLAAFGSCGVGLQRRPLQCRSG